MRAYVRHPINMPITIRAARRRRAVSMDNFGMGGLAVTLDHPLGEGCLVHVLIPCVDPPFEADALVRWCRHSPGSADYTAGLAFADTDQEFRLRMVEQLCHIEAYRQSADREGRCLSSEQAAQEWIEQHAAFFPR